MRKATICIGQLLTKKKNYPNIPQQFWEYIHNADRCKVQDRWLSVLMGPDSRSILQDIDGRFQRAGKILNLSPSKIAKALDLDPKNVAHNRLDSFFAQFRVVFFLGGQGFSNITPLRRSSKPSADFVAEYRSIRYAVEVFHSSSDNYQWPNHESRRCDLIRYFVDKAKRKRDQVDATREKKQCEKGILVLVLDSYPAKALLCRSDFQHILEQVHNKLVWGESYYFGIITGMESMNQGLDDILFPTLRLVGQESPTPAIE